MTTATTPRQPVKRAKGRAQTLHADPYETVVGWQLFADEYEEAVERMARAMFAEDFGIRSWSTEKAIWRVERDGFIAQAVAALKSIGIADPRKKRKQP